MLKGMNIVADLVGSTMGPHGKGVAISHDKNTRPWITRDGVSVLRETSLEDSHEDVGNMLLRMASEKTLADAGDGTSQTVILARSIYQRGLEEIKGTLFTRGRQQHSLKRGIEKAIAIVIGDLILNSEEVTLDKIESVATISANNDPELGKLIADAYKKVGKEGRIDVEMSNSVETYTQVVEGYEFDRGYMHAEYVNVPEKGFVEYKEPQILVVDYDISLIATILPILQPMIQTGKPIVIIAKGVEGEAHSTFVVNKVKHNVPICAIKVSNLYQRESLSDIAITTGATLISDESGLKLENATVKHLGSCDKIVATANKTTIIGGHGNKDAIKKRSDEIKVLIAEEDVPEVLTIHQTRLARLNASIGVVHVGAATLVEAKEKYDRVDDAVRASKSAIEEGVSIGGGVALFNARLALGKFEFCDTEDEKAGAMVIYHILRVPISQILDNAGLNSSYIISLIAEGQYGEVMNFGYNVKTGEFGDMKEMGVIDPTKVLRVALQNAGSVAASLLATDSLIVGLKERPTSS